MSVGVDTALHHLKRYLQDEIPPTAAATALATLMAQPPDILMQQVGTWSAEQSQARSVPVCDLLLHALKKVQITGELGLFDRETVENYLDRISTIAIRICPPDDRALLRTNLSAMRMSHGVTLRGNEPLPVVAAPIIPAEEDAQAARRFSLILDRVSREGAPQADAQSVAQLLMMAAQRSQNGGQLNDYLEQLRPLTGKEGNVFVILGGAMPSWDLPALAPAPAQVGAMEKIIELAEDPAVTMKRFRELVTAAVDKFNEGALAAAVWMLDVAQDTITERELEPAAVDRVRAEAVEAINAAQLRKYTEKKTRHAALKIALEFFPLLRLPALFKSLRGEPRAERRRTVLGFIEAYGALGRDAALDELERELPRADVDTYYLRNLIYILHRVARDSDETLPREVETLTQASARGQNIYVIKEASTALGQIKSDDAVTLLTTRLAEFEALLLRNDASYPAAEMQKLLDRIISSLARIGTPAALLTIARHGMKANPLLGDTRARLAALSQHDLSFDSATTAVLLKSLREEIPGKIFGRLLPKRQEPTVCLIEALSGTRSEEIEEVFRDVASRFADQDVGRAAAKVLEKWEPPKPSARAEPAATLAGELEFFGLPSVMQSLADMRATGMLALSTKQGQAAAKLVMSDGKFLNARRGPIGGTAALFDMLERPITGTFAFVPYPPEKMQSDLEPQDVIGLVLEGVRRHDELQRMIAEVPDGTRFTKTNVKPTPPTGEDDPALVRDVWLRATSGTPVQEWERQVPIDAYRVRRLVAHWLEQGALTT